MYFFRKYRCIKCGKMYGELLGCHCPECGSYVENFFDSEIDNTIVDIPFVMDTTEICLIVESCKLAAGDYIYIRGDKEFRKIYEVDNSINRPDCVYVAIEQVGHRILRKDELVKILPEARFY